ncbi:MAG TPA: hypothetical protein VIN59_04935 [Alphaproteobacteria bacterium]
MTVTFQQKQDLIDLLSTPSRWRNVFDMEFFDNALHQRHYGTPLTDKKGNAVGSRFNAFDITDDAADALSMTRDQMVDAVKLLLARDFGIEPDLRAVNARHYENTAYLMRDAMKYGQLGNLDSVLIPWDDVTEFEGAYIATPNRFTVELKEKGVDVRLSANDHEGVLSVGKAAKTALGAEKPPIDLREAKADLSRIFFMLSKGSTIRNRMNQEVIYMLMHVRNAMRLANSLRDKIMRAYNLKGYEFAVIAVKNDLCLIATDPNTLEATASRKPSPYVPANAP